MKTKETIRVVIETPKGSSEKYAYEKETGFFLLKKILPAGMVFPYDFGFIPDTLGEDGDPLDIMVLSEFHSFPGVVMDCRLIGGFKARQGKRKDSMEENDRFIAIPVVSAIFKELTDWSKVPLTIIKELEDFFINYNKEEQKIFKTMGYLTAKQAMKKIKMHTL
jgi:inorganic pyrophosphatase